MFSSWRRGAPLRRVVALWILSVAAVLLGPGSDAHALTPCSTPAGSTTALRSSQCVNNRERRARGRGLPRCFGADVLNSRVYPNTRYCGSGPEAIAQARLISWIDPNATPSQADARVNWEVTTQTDATERGRADVTIQENDSSPLNVYEVRLTDTDRWADVRVALARYVDGLDDPNPPGAKAGDTLHPLGADGDFNDYFYIPSGGQCANGEDKYNLYHSYFAGHGIVAVQTYDVGCFDPDDHLRRPGRPIERIPPQPNKPDEDDPDLRDPPQLPPAEDTPPLRVPGTARQPEPRQYPPGATVPQFVPICYRSNLTRIACTAIHEVAKILDGALQFVATLFGDPHITTVDGASYDLQSVGEFHYVMAPQFADMDLQLRFVPQGASASVARAAAMNIGGHVAEVDSRQRSQTTLLLDGKPYQLADQATVDLGDGASITRSDTSYMFVWPGANDRPVFWWGPDQSSLYIPPGTDSSGLVGSADGNRDNDLVDDDTGDVLSGDVSPGTIHSSFADSWRVTPDDSLFTYPTGESTETYTDRAFPANIVKLSDLDPGAVVEGTRRCHESGVADGPLLNDCVLDWALTSDEHFLAAAAAQASPGVVVGSKKLDANDELVEDFDHDVAPNLAGPSYAQGAGSGTFVGPLGRNARYAFTVPDLPSHDSVTVHLDFIALGTWSQSQVADSIAVNADDATLPSSALTVGFPSRSGTTSSGTSYTVYPITFTIPHGASQLRVGLATNLAVDTGRLIGLDNIDVQVHRVNPQSFTVSLPAHLSDGAPAGAGNLETIGSEDDYAFTTTTTRALQIDVDNCSSSTVTWTLRSQAGATVTTGGCGRRLTGPVSPGNYVLAFSGNGHVATYELSAFVQPAPDVTATALPATFDGTSSGGAGNLETTASEDDYTFTTASDRALILDFSDCGPWNDQGISYELVNSSTGTTLRTGGCGHEVIPTVPAGAYRLKVTRNGHVQTYKLSIFSKPDPDVIQATLPATYDANSAGGAGNLETTASEDHYVFTTATTRDLMVGVTNDAGFDYNADAELVDESDGHTIEKFSVAYFAPHAVKSLPAGTYRLKITKSARIGTYKLSIFSKPDPDVINATLPATYDSNSAGGAGNLETTASEDDYLFTTSSTRTLQVSVTDDPAFDYNADAELVDESDGHTVEKFGVAYFAPYEIASLPAGSYRLKITKEGRVGTYTIAILSRPDPDVIQTTLPASFDANSSGGAGNLETTASEDDYDFTTTAAAPLRVNVSDSGAFDYNMSAKLVRESDGRTVESWSAYYFDAHETPTLPAGSYRLAITGNGHSGTYRVAIVNPQVFQAAVPASYDAGASNGAGNLETRASEDDYLFTTQTAQTVVVGFAGCGDSLEYGIDYKLVDESTGQSIKTGGCGHDVVSDLPAGSYRVKVTRAGRYGTYRFALASPETFDVSLPIDTASSSPGAGAGTVESIAAEDRYRFTVPAGKSLRIEPSSCEVSWGLTNSNGDLLDHDRCADYQGASRTVENLPAGTYTLRFSGNPHNYSVKAFLVPDPDVFDVTLPLDTGSSSPGAGAGNLETSVSEDRYRFTTTATSDLRVETTSGCDVSWRVVNSAGSDVGSGGCSGLYGNNNQTITGLPADTYTLRYTGRQGTYNVHAFLMPSPQVFDVSLPLEAAAIGSGAGNLETALSEDRYRFTTTSVRDVRIEPNTCEVHWRLVNSTGDVVAHDGCDNNEAWEKTVTNLPADTYTLRFTRRTNRPDYNVKAYIVPDPQVFDISLPLEAATIGSGAGNLETMLSEDRYRFTTTAVRDIRIEPNTCEVHWRLVNSTGDTIAHDGCDNNEPWEKTVTNLPADTYTLRFTRRTNRPDYNVKAYIVPDPQVFDVNLPLEAATVGGGAGNLETAFSEDRYRFTTTSVRDVRIEPNTCEVHWRLVNSTGDVVAHDGCDNNEPWEKTVTNLPADTYTLRFTRRTNRPDYNVKAYVVPDPQVFDVNLPLEAATIGSGAGNLETMLSEDRYRFTTTSVRDVRIEPNTCEVHWRLVNSTGDVVAHDGCDNNEAWEKTVTNLPADTYTLRFTRRTNRPDYNVKAFITST